MAPQRYPSLDSDRAFWTVFCGSVWGWLIAREPSGVLIIHIGPFVWLYGNWSQRETSSRESSREFRVYAREDRRLMQRIRPWRSRKTRSGIPKRYQRMF